MGTLKRRVVQHRIARRVGTGVLVAVLVVAIAVVVARRDGAASARVTLGTGSAWFFAEPSGELVLLDGPTATRLARVPLGSFVPADGTIDVVQDDGAAIVVSPSTGAITRVDGATFATAPPASVAGVEAVVATGDRLAALAQNGGVIRQFDATTLRPIATEQATSGVVTGLVATSDRVWTVSADGQVRTHSTTVVETARSAPAGSQLITAADRPLAVHQPTSSTTFVDSEGGDVAADCLSGGSIASELSGSGPDDEPWVVGVRPDSGVVAVVDVVTDECWTIADLDPADGARYGRAAVRDGYVFVPDFVRGDVAVIDPRSNDRVVARVFLGLGEPATFDLFAQDGFVYYHDRARTRAGVIDADLVARVIDLAGADDEGTVPEREQPADEPPEPSSVELRCGAVPGTVAVGEDVTLSALVDDGLVASDHRWDTDGGSPATTDEPQPTAAWATVGEKTISLSALVSDSGTSTTASAECAVVVEEITSATTTTSPPGTAPPTITAPPTAPPTTAPATTSPPTTGGPVTPPPPTVGPPPTPPPPPPPPPPSTTQPPPVTTAPPSTTSPPVVPVPDFTFDPPNPTVGETVTFTNTSTMVDGTSTYAWTFDGGSPATATGPGPIAVTWDQPGSFEVTLGVDNQGVAGVPHRETVPVSDAGCQISGQDVQTVASATECDALTALFLNTNGSSWTNNTGWNTATDPCGWHGVVCDGNGVFALDLFRNNLGGTLPAAIGDFANLRRLSIEANVITGPIPSTIGNLTNVEFFLLDDNDFNGSLPPEIGGMVNVRFITLYLNNLSGPIPNTVGNLTALESFRAELNALSGAIPPEFGNLPNLQILTLDRNNLSGAIPAQLASLTNLDWLFLTDNALAGEVPAGLQSLTALTAFSLNGNQCLFTPNATFAAWLAGFDASWDDGCLPPEHTAASAFAAGQGAGGLLNEAGATRVMCALPDSSAQPLGLICQGLTDTFTGEVVSIIAGSDADQTEQLATIAAALAADPAIDGILGTTSNITVSSVSASQDAGLVIPVGAAVFNPSAELNVLLQGGSLSFICTIV